MLYKGKSMRLDDLIQHQWTPQFAMPEGLLEQRVLELERLGLVDIDDLPGMPSPVRQFAIASLQSQKPPYFITIDDDLLDCRDILEVRYGMHILSIPEALMLLKDQDGPPN